MTLIEQLHKSKAHRDGFDPSCPCCIKEEGIDGIIEHLAKCAKQNESDAKADARFEPPLRTPAGTVAAEQRRVLAILKLYRMQTRRQEAQA